MLYDIRIGIDASKSALTRVLAWGAKKNAYANKKCFNASPAFPDYGNFFSEILGGWGACIYAPLQKVFFTPHCRFGAPRRVNITFNSCEAIC